MNDLIDAVGQLRRENTAAIGIGVPGLVQQPEGVILTLPNIPGAEHMNMRAQMAERLRLPVSVDNDANCFTLAEALHGAGKGHDIVVGITLGTGVGGGMVLDGKLYHGSHGYAAEIGHMLLKPGEPPFETNDRRGDVEQFLSGNALRQRCQAAEDPSQYLHGETCSFLHPELFREISWLCVNLIHMVDPSIVVLGGSVGHALKSHVKSMKNEMLKWILPGTPLPVIAFGELEEAATLGAALLTQQ